MKCEPCTSLQESAADYLLTSSSDTRQLSLLSGSLMPVESCENEPQEDGSPSCTCGKAMSGCSIHPSTPDEWIASMQDSLAKTLALLESRQAYLREPDQVFTVKSCALLASFDRTTCSWRTLQQSFLTDSEPFSETWPRWGMTAGGSAFAHPMSERRIPEIDGSAYVAGRLIPTPTACDHKGSGRLRLERGPNNNLRDWFKINYGFLYPPVKAVAYLMGFPIAWASLKATETRKSRFKQRSHGVSLVGSKAA